MSHSSQGIPSTNYSPETYLPFFVYGTLRRDQSNFHLLKNAIASSNLARFEGAQLWDLGPYPMAIETMEGNIEGELFHIAPQKFVSVLAALDRLEGVRPRNPFDARGIYHRAARQVEIQIEDSSNGFSHKTAWMYFGRPDVARRGRLIVQGDWKARFITRQSS